MQLDFNRIGNNGGIAILAAIRESHEMLSYLNLSTCFFWKKYYKIGRNDLSDHIIEAVLSTLQESTNLKEIHIGNNDFTTFAYLEMIKVVQSRVTSFGASKDFS